MGDFDSLLQEALDIAQLLRGNEDESDHSYLEQPSISPHPQNFQFRDWTLLIELTRDAWLAIAEIDADYARSTVVGWWRKPQSIYKRLCLFAATQLKVVAPRVALGFLTEREGWWIWSIETRREAIRLLVALASVAEEADLIILEDLICRGPPREMYRADISEDQWNEARKHAIWLMLAKLQHGGAKLTEGSQKYLSEIQSEFPAWSLEADERDEFPSWMGSGNELKRRIPSPPRRRELADWLRANPSSDVWLEDNWRQRCRDDFRTASAALLQLSKQNNWPVDRWREALQAWSDETLLARSWRWIAPILEKMPIEVTRELTGAISWWLRAQSTTFQGHKEAFFSLCRRVVDFDAPTQMPSASPVSRAINHPIGHVADGLIRWTYRQQPDDGQSLPEEVLPLFTLICTGRRADFAFGRVIMSSHLVMLFRVDRGWTTMHLLPYFDWSRSEDDARMVWEGFLLAPRFHRALFEQLKQPFLDTATRTAQLAEHASQFAQLLTYIALEQPDLFSPSELATATRQLDVPLLESCLDTVISGISGAGPRVLEYWHNRVEPYLKRMWPKGKQTASPAISERFARLAVEASDAFPHVVERVGPWIQPVRHSAFVMRRLIATQKCSNFPFASLSLLGRLILREGPYVHPDLRKCLDEIRAADPSLEASSPFAALWDFARLAHP